MIFFSGRFSRRRWLVSGAAALLLILGVVFLVVRKKEAVPLREYGRYIESYTTGVISRQSTIRIRLAGEAEIAHRQNEELPSGVLEFSPSVNGKAYWADARTIEFRPEEELAPDREYEAELHLGQLLKVPESLENFPFSFQTIKPDFTIEFAGLQAAGSTSLTKMKLIGTVYTSDGETSRSVEQVVSARYDRPVKITWNHDSIARKHGFSVEDIVRNKRSAKDLRIAWDGSALDVAKKSSETFSVPREGEFNVLAVKAVQDDERYVLYQFSNPVGVGQELNGLVGVDNTAEPAYTIDGSWVKVYLPDQLEGNYTAFVNEGVADITGKRIPERYVANVFFENRLPSVQIPGKGVVLPDSGRLMMPFEAVNLNAVDISIVRIYEDNVPQYFQNNGFDEGNELRKIGKPIVQTTIRLDGDRSVNLGKKNRFMLDIDNYMRAEPGAIYRVIIGFRKAYSLYDCDIKKAAPPDDENGYDDYNRDYDNSPQGVDDDDAFWSRYDNFYPEGYNWEQRDDVCSESYYTRQRWAVRNLVASNIGLIAKRGSDNSMLVAVTNILDAQPMKGVTLQVLDFQKQVIQSASSDAEGFARFQLQRKPYLLVARRDDERGYLRVDDPSALPLARFDVGGEQVQKGLKGFIYGERGVWRPGDSIFLTFVLDDHSNRLPQDHPVEFEFYDPRGQLYQRVVRSESVGGFYRFPTATAATAPTGTWMAKVKVGGATFQKPVKIETVMPNRLKVDLTFGNKTALTSESNTGKLSARWLFGGKAQRLKARVEAYVSPAVTTFKKFEGFVFDDPVLNFGTQTQPVFDGQLDENGEANVTTNIHLENRAPGQLKASFLTRIFEPGGNFSIGSVSLPYHIYRGYVGLKIPGDQPREDMLTTDKDHRIALAVVNVNGEPVTGTRNVELELYKIQWRWWWDETGDELSNFTQNEYNKLIRTASVPVTNGRGAWTLRVPGAEWGRYLLKVRDPATGHSTGKVIYIDWPNWAQRLQQDNPTEAAMLSFTADKEKYRVGETATLTIPTAAAGRALISFENGSRVLKAQWIDTKKGQTRFDFKVEEGMAPNVFVTVSVLQRHGQTVNDLPIRMYGAIPLLVEDPGTQLRPVIRMPDKIRPGELSLLTVSEASGNAMTYTVAIVDEGLLDLTNFKTPDPHAAFYAREALGVQSWDLFDYVIGSYGGGLERILSIGGDQAAGSNKSKTINRFKSVVRFLGPFTLGKGERRTTTFRLPQYVGSVRAMVVAGQAGKFGFAEKAVAVKKPLMILATVPRVLGPSERFDLPVNVFAMENSVREVTVRIESAAFSSSGIGQTIRFSRPGDQLVNFSLATKNATGSGKVRIIAQSGRETAVQEIELEIRNPNPAVTRVTQQEIRPGEAWNTNFMPAGLAGTNTNSIEISSIPSLNLGSRLNYLIRYPYGCVEQITSSVFPQLYLDQLMDLSAAEKARSSRNIKSGISRLRAFQLPSGGLSYWPGNTETDAWGTNYAGHFLLSAQAKGYSLPVGFMDSWKKFQRGEAQRWSPDTRLYYANDLVQSYRLFLLALSGAPELGAMNRLREFKYISPPARWRLAAAYRLAGQPEAAAKLVAGLSTTVPAYNLMYGTYGSDLRDEAMILETLTLLGRRQDAARMMRTVAAHLSTSRWYSTQTTAYALLAIAGYCGRNDSGAKLQFSFKSGTAATQKTVNSYLWQTALPVSGALSVHNTGKNTLYVRLTRIGQPAPGREDAAPINPDLLRMTVNYLTTSGQPIDISRLRQGTDFVAQVTVRNPSGNGRYENLALSQVFPSGWEILNTRVQEIEGSFKSSPSDFQDVRDDRVYTYFSLNEGRESTYHVMLTAAYAGRYYLPATYCEAMYDASVNSWQKGRWVEIVR